MIPFSAFWDTGETLPEGFVTLLFSEWPICVLHDAFQGQTSYPAQHRTKEYSMMSHCQGNSKIRLKWRLQGAIALFTGIGNVK